MDLSPKNLIKNAKLAVVTAVGVGTLFLAPSASAQKTSVKHGKLSNITNTNQKIDPAKLGQDRYKEKIAHAMRSQSDTVMTDAMVRHNLPDLALYEPAVIGDGKPATPFALKYSAVQENKLNERDGERKVDQTIELMHTIRYNEKDSLFNAPPITGFAVESNIGAVTNYVETEMQPDRLVIHGGYRIVDGKEVTNHLAVNFDLKIEDGMLKKRNADNTYSALENGGENAVTKLAVLKDKLYQSTLKLSDYIKHEAEFPDKWQKIFYDVLKDPQLFLANEHSYNTSAQQAPASDTIDMTRLKDRHYMQDEANHFKLKANDPKYLAAGFTPAVLSRLQKDGFSFTVELSGFKGEQPDEKHLPLQLTLIAYKGIREGSYNADIAARRIITDKNKDGTFDQRDFIQSAYDIGARQEGVTYNGTALSGQMLNVVASPGRIWGFAGSAGVGNAMTDFTFEMTNNPKTGQLELMSRKITDKDTTYSSVPNQGPELIPALTTQLVKNFYSAVESDLRGDWVMNSVHLAIPASGAPVIVQPVQTVQPKKKPK
jgi:hypothetical protein